MPAKSTFTAEQGMTLAGIGLAALATGFAYLAIERNDGVPKIGGAEHLAIFARPANLRGEQPESGAILVSEAQTLPESHSPAPIDYLPTATIRGDATGRLEVQKVLKDRVLVRGPSGRAELRPGDVAKGLGRLQEIRLVRGRWTAVIVPEKAN